MPKLPNGHRFTGTYEDMKSRSLSELWGILTYYESELENPDRQDHPDWLRGRIGMVERLLAQKEDALMQKLIEGRGYKKGEKWMEGTYTRSQPNVVDVGRRD